MKTPTKTEVEVNIQFTDGKDGQEHWVPKPVSDALDAVCSRWLSDRDYHEIDFTGLVLSEGRDIQDLIGQLWVIRGLPTIKEIAITLTIKGENN
jgi:hypothetical protein